MAIAVASVAVVLSQWYVYWNPAYDVTTLIAGVLLPLVLGSVVLIANGDRAILFAFLALFWSLIDDAPVYFDSVFTWPEVTRFHPAAPHIFLEIVLHVLTIAFLVLAILAAQKRERLSRARTLGVTLLMLLAFVLSYAQNIPLDAVQAFVENGWYQLDVVEHALAVLVLYLAIREARRPNAGPISGLSD